MGVGFIWLYSSLAVIAVIGAIIVWFLTKNLWATITIVVAMAVTAGIIAFASAVSTRFTNTAELISWTSTVIQSI